MSLLRRINALMSKIQPSNIIMTAVFEDGRKEIIPQEEIVCVWAMKKAINPNSPKIICFECESDPEAAKEETFFFHCLTETGDLSTLGETAEAQ